jgi:hypothetical protein
MRMSRENPIHQQDQALIERIHAQHLERIGLLGDEAIQFQDASYAVGRQRGAMEANAELLAAARKVLSGLNARIDAAVESRNPCPVFDGIAELHDAINKATQPLNPA